MYRSLSIHSCTDGHLGYFQILAIVNSTAIKIGVRMYFCIGVLGSLGHIPRSGKENIGSKISDIQHRNIFAGIIT